MLKIEKREGILYFNGWSIETNDLTYYLSIYLSKKFDTKINLKKHNTRENILIIQVNKLDSIYTLYWKDDYIQSFDKEDMKKYINDCISFTSYAIKEIGHADYILNCE